MGTLKRQSRRRLTKQDDLQAMFDSGFQPPQDAGYTAEEIVCVMLIPQATTPIEYRSGGHPYYAEWSAACEAAKDPVGRPSGK